MQKGDTHNSYPSQRKTPIHDGVHYEGYIKPLDDNHPPKVFHIILNNAFIGNLVYNSDWELDLHPGLSSVPGDCVLTWWN